MRRHLRDPHLRRRSRIPRQELWLHRPRAPRPRRTDQAHGHEQGCHEHHPTARLLHRRLLRSFASTCTRRHSVTPGQTQRPRTDGKGPSAQGRGEVSVRSEGGAAMRLPIQTAGQRNSIEARTPLRYRQDRFRSRPTLHAVSGSPGPGHTRRMNRKGQPVRGWPPRSGPCGPGSLPYFATGFLNSSSASVRFSSILVSFASSTGLSSISVFSVCGYWTLPTGFQSL